LTRKGLPGLIGTSSARSGFFFRVSFVRGGISVAAGRTSGRDFGPRAQHCVGARHLLCSSHSFELEIRLHHPHRFLNPDYSVFDCGRVALSEDKLNFAWEATGPILADRRRTRSNSVASGLPSSTSWAFREYGTGQHLKGAKSSFLSEEKAKLQSME
jgi:hypothetical protein